MLCRCEGVQGGGREGAGHEGMKVCYARLPSSCKRANEKVQDDRKIRK